MKEQEMRSIEITSITDTSDKIFFIFSFLSVYLLNIQKDKIKSPSKNRRTSEKGYPAVSLTNSSTKLTFSLLQAKTPFSSFAQEVFTSRIQISIPTCENFSDTVMAVAADSHCNFLIPEYVKKHIRQRVVHSIERVYSFVRSILTHNLCIFKWYKRKSESFFVYSHFLLYSFSFLLLKIQI